MAVSQETVDTSVASHWKRLFDRPRVWLLIPEGVGIDRLALEIILDSIVFERERRRIQVGRSRDGNGGAHP